MHGLEDGDMIRFSEVTVVRHRSLKPDLAHSQVQGMEQLNEGLHRVKVINPYSFSIGDTSSFTPYTTGGIVQQQHRRKYSHFLLTLFLLLPSEC